MIAQMGISENFHKGVGQNSLPFLGQLSMPIDIQLAGRDVITPAQFRRPNSLTEQLLYE
jgi:hypothetical protein